MHSNSPIIRISHVRLWVRDLARSATFYHRVLGLDPTVDGHAGTRVQGCATREDSSRSECGVVFSQQLADAEPPGLPEHISFEVASLDDAMRAYGRAREFGAQAIEPRLSGGRWRTLIFDPDGHKLELVTRETCLGQEAAG